MNLRLKYLLVKETVILLGLFEWMSFGLGAFFVGAKDFQNSLLFFAIMAGSYLLSAHLGYKAMELMLRLNDAH